MAKIDRNGKGYKRLLFARFWSFFNFLKTVQKGLKTHWECFKINLKALDFIFEPFLKS